MKKVNKIQDKYEKKINVKNDIKQYEDTDKKCTNGGVEEELPDFELDLEVDEESPVQTVDGVIIEGDEEIARLLFYHYKTNGIDIEEELVRCRCIAELRVSRTKLKQIVKDINENIKNSRRNVNGREINIFQEKLPMYY
jgi:hypothetical protein